MAVSTDTVAPAAGDTALVSEQAANGLARAVASAVHTAGTNIWTYTVTFTYTGSTSVTITKMALFDAATGGNLIAEDLLTSAVPFSTSGDNVPLQYQIIV